MNKPVVFLPTERVVRTILEIRGSRVILAPDLAAVYGVEVRRLNEQVKRNQDRFPADFAFRLSSEETAEVIAKCDHLQNLKFASVEPLAFTEHGAIAAAFVLNSPAAVEMSVEVVRAFVRLREVAASHVELARRLDSLEARTSQRFGMVQDAIAELAEWSHKHPGVSITTEKKGE